MSLFELCVPTAVLHHVREAAKVLWESTTRPLSYSSPPL